MLLGERKVRVASGNELSTRSRTGDGDSDMDVALTYIKHAGQPSEEIDEKKLVRKIDWRIVPIMFACQTMQFIDKVLINVGFPPTECTIFCNNPRDVDFSMLLLWVSRRISSLKATSLPGLQRSFPFHF